MTGPEIARGWVVIAIVSLLVSIGARDANGPTSDIFIGWCVMMVVFAIIWRGVIYLQKWREKRPTRLGVILAVGTFLLLGVAKLVDHLDQKEKAEAARKKQLDEWARIGTFSEKR